MNIVFFTFISLGVLSAIYCGNIPVVTEAMAKSSGEAVQRLISLTGIICVWMGIAKVAERAGLLQLLARYLQPFFRRLFPSIPTGHPAMGSILLNLGANILGLGSAATPFGLKAMSELQTLNSQKNRATDAMCTFLAINSSGITLLPATIIAIRVTAGSKDPTLIVASTIIVNLLSTLVAVILDLIFRQREQRKRGKWK